MLLASSSRRGMTSRMAASSRTARAVCPVNRHSTDIDMLVKSFDQIASLISATSGEAIPAGCEIRDHAWFDHLVSRKDHSADNSFLWRSRAQGAAGIKEAELGNI